MKKQNNTKKIKQKKKQKNIFKFFLSNIFFFASITNKKQTARDTFTNSVTVTE